MMAESARGRTPLDALVAIIEGAGQYNRNA
jgi:hypothetical protein